MNPAPIEIVATVLFACAVIHTFLIKKFEEMAHKYPEGSIGENTFHFLGEVEAVFGIWAAIFIIIYSGMHGFALYDSHHKLIGGAVFFLEGLNYTEPAFVFVIMCMAATRPIIELSKSILNLISKMIPLPSKISFYATTLIFGPILGSFITEPAAMTVTALLLHRFYYEKGMSETFKYATIGLLFVNISIGGTLTNFAAPPVLMVASKWHWDTWHMVSNFGYKAIISILICTIGTTFYFRKELAGEVDLNEKETSMMKPTWWMTLIHVISIALVVKTAHHMVFFLGLFLFFLGFCAVTTEYQDKLKLKESLLVGLFLGGLVTLGSMQKWWLKVVLVKLGNLQLYFGSAALTAITDNAALTYLGSLVELSDPAKYSLVAGAVLGGGLTVIANAPNPAGFGILKSSFGEDGISPVKLLLGALIPTIIGLILFQILPTLGSSH